MTHAGKILMLWCAPIICGAFVECPPAKALGEKLAQGKARAAG